MAITITKPTIGGSEDTWGLTINTALDDVAAALNGTAGTVAPDHTVLTINGTNVTSTAAELNILDGVTATTAELNVLDGVTATTAELNILDGVTATTAELNILDGVTATTAELNILDGVTATTAELNILDGVVATTAEINYLDGVTSSIQAQINSVIAGESGGTVTSVGLSVPTGFAVSGSPVTTSGTLGLSFASGYSLLTSAQATSISNIPTTTSQLTNDSGFITSSSVPTATSQLTNNSGFITSSSVPTATSQLTNDSGFITSQYTQPTSVGAVGTYAFLVRNSNTASITEGQSISGSSLLYGSVDAANPYIDETLVYGQSGTSPSGTWRAMGKTTSSLPTKGTVYLRIS